MRPVAAPSRTSAASTRPRRWARGAMLTVLTGSLAVAGAPAASAAPGDVPAAAARPGLAALEDPRGPAGLPATVSSTPLPTAQVDGVVWAQVVSGTTVYVTGEFTSARPPGAAPGSGEVPRSNAMAYDLRTGELLDWAPSLNAQGLAAAASPDGSRIYLGGDFTQVDGQARYRVVALDAATGALDPGFVPGLNARVRSLVATGDTVYAGGVFTQANTYQRAHLAAFTADGGEVTTWDPRASITAGDLPSGTLSKAPATPEVLTMVAPEGTGTLVLGGRFTRLGGAKAYGLGAVDLLTGEPRPFAAEATVRDAGVDSGITALAASGATVFGTGYVYGRGGNLEGSFAADASTGEVGWVNDCIGDTYGVAPVGEVLYTIGHAHDCSAIGGHPESSQSRRAYQPALATTAAPSPAGRDVVGGPFAGRPAPELLHWLPQLEPGRYTGQVQAAWAITHADGYLLLAGEFPSVNGQRQQSLVRFAAPGAGPAPTSADKPRGYAELTPVAAAAEPGRVRLSWQSAWDRDTAGLRYEVLRDGAVISETVEPSTWWHRPRLAVTDDDASLAVGGPRAYRVRVTDGSGLSMTSAPLSVDVAPGQSPPPAPSPGADAVAADAPRHHWRLDGASADAGRDSSGADDLTLPPSVRGAASGPGPGGATGVTFSGGSAASSIREAGPLQLSQELWVRTTTRTGGKLLGFEDSPSGASTRYDRQLWMGDDGKVRFGINDRKVTVVTSPGALNDGGWHHVVASFGGGVMELFVDGERVAAQGGVRQAEQMDGYWRVGGGTLAGWPAASRTTDFSGDLAGVALYGAPLSPERVVAHRDAALVAAPPAPPAPAEPPVVPSDPDPADPEQPEQPDPEQPDPEDPVVPPAGSPSVSDDFARDVARGWGEAAVGGAWSTSPVGSTSVAGGQGRLTVAPGRGATALLTGAPTQDADVRVDLGVIRPSPTASTWAAVVGRSVTRADDYRLKLRPAPDGSLSLTVLARVGGSERPLATAAVPREVADADAPLSVRFQVAPGAAPGTTALAASVWQRGAPEPAAWQVRADDATPELAGPGGVGVWTYLSSRTPDGQQLTVSADDLEVRPSAP